MHHSASVIIIMEEVFGVDPSAVDRNSWAIVQLLEGNQTESLSSLHAALEGSRAQLRKMGPRRVALILERRFDVGILPVSLEGVVVPLGDPSESASPHNIFRRYRCLFSIEGDDADSELLAPEVTVVLLYNLAVIYQELGFVNSDHASLVNAMRLYELARSVLSQAKEAKRQKLAIDLMELEVALINNLGHMCSHFFNYERTIALRESLRQVVADLDPNRLSEEAHHFFRRNDVLAFPRKDGTAPAA